MLIGVNSLLLFLLILIYFIILLLFHNKYKNYWWSNFFIISSILILTTQILNSSFDLILFLIGSISYLVLDTIAVYKKHWKYNTKSGYVLWAGPAWGFLTLVVFRLNETISSELIILLALSVLFLLVTNIKKNLSPKNYFASPWIPFAFICLFLSPSLFLVSLAIGIIFEYIAVELLKTWTYPKPIYGLIGLGYGTLMVYLQLVLELIGGNKSVVNLFFVIILTVFVLLHKLGLLKNK